MYKKSELYFINCIYALHAGSGENHSYIDNPIQREKHTMFPKIEGSGNKGAIKEAFEGKSGYTNSTIEILFGKDDNADASSLLGFPDARLLFFPVRSHVGNMAWITCLECSKPYKERILFLIW